MATRSCRKCGHAVSRTDKTCPECGAKLRGFLDGCGFVALMVAVVLLIIAVTAWTMGWFTGGF